MNHTNHADRPTTNRLMGLVNKTNSLPNGIKTFVLSKMLGRVVPMVGSAGIRYEEVTQNRVICTLRNRRPMHNHIKGLHAAAMALLAETATGFVVGVNIPDDKILLIKSLHVDYKKVAKGDLKAVATLTEEQRQQILTEPKGEVLVACTVTDSSGEEPIQVQMLWAWIPKNRG